MKPMMYEPETKICQSKGKMTFGFRKRQSPPLKGGHCRVCSQWNSMFDHAMW